MTWPMAFGWALLTSIILGIVGFIASILGPFAVAVTVVVVLTLVLRMLGTEWA